MANRRKDPQDKKAVPSRANSTMDAEEQELWNLDASEHDDPSDDPEPPGAAEDHPPHDDADDIDDSGLNEDEDEAADAAVDPLRVPDAAPPRRPASGGGEKIALGLLAAVLIGGSIWGVVTFVATLPETRPEHKIEFPVTGTSVTIGAADTYWRKPDRTKDTGVRLDTRLLPAAVITLAESSGDGTLRFFFRDQDNDIMGDANTQVVSAGKFDGNGTNSIEIYSTAGFLDPGDHAAYTTGQIDTWFLEIREGPAPEAGRSIPGSEFKVIATVPISFNRK